MTFPTRSWPFWRICPVCACLYGRPHHTRDGFALHPAKGDRCEGAAIRWRDWIPYNEETAAAAKARRDERFAAS